MPRTAKSKNTVHSFLFLLPKIVAAVPLFSLSLQRSTSQNTHPSTSKEPPLTTEELYVYFSVSMFLVILGGVFAGLTIALMGQDEINLKVIESSGDSPKQRKNAKRVLSLLSRSKHWVLVTLLLSNVITNESLPIVLDKCTGGGGIGAVIFSTVLIVLFGEIIPQSICVRYGLEIGSFFVPFVLVLMYILYPIVYPIALLLDYSLGEDHGTMYKKAGLKTLVTLHQTGGPITERLSADEVTIISSVLDLKEKSVQSIMTPIEDTFTLSSDTIMDDSMVVRIFNSGFSRIPIHAPNEPLNFIGMLLVRILINYDPDDCLNIASFPLATLPETPPKTSCLNILNYFQEGKSHMVVVSNDPGSPNGAIGILTLEDVIEELIGEEIIDESDVFVDIHNAIKRNEPGPLSRKHLTSYFHTLVTASKSKNSNSNNNNNSEKRRKRKNWKNDGSAVSSSASSLISGSDNGDIHSAINKIDATANYGSIPEYLNNENQEYDLTVVHGNTTMMIPLLDSDVSTANQNFSTSINNEVTLAPGKVNISQRDNNIIVRNGKAEDIVVLQGLNKKIMKPMNLASDPLKTRNAFVTIKKPES